MSHILRLLLRILVPPQHTASLNCRLFKLKGKPQIPSLISLPLSHHMQSISFVLGLHLHKHDLSICLRNHKFKSPCSHLQPDSLLDLFSTQGSERSF